MDSSSEISTLKASMRGLQSRLSAAELENEQIKDILKTLLAMIKKSFTGISKLFDTTKTQDARIKVIEAFEVKNRNRFEAFKMDARLISIDKDAKMCKFGKFSISFADLSPEFTLIESFFRGIVRQCLLDEDIKKFTRSNPSEDFKLIFDATFHLWNELCDKDCRKITNDSKDLKIGELIQKVVNMRSNLGK